MNKRQRLSLTSQKIKTIKTDIQDYYSESLSRYITVIRGDEKMFIFHVTMKALVSEQYDGYI